MIDRDSLDKLMLADIIEYCQERGEDDMNILNIKPTIIVTKDLHGKTNRFEDRGSEIRVN